MEQLRNLRNDVAASRLAFEPVREKIKIVAHRATELESRPTAKSFVLAVAQSIFRQHHLIGKNRAFVEVV